MAWPRIGGRRLPLPPTDLPGHDDWQAGDLAECIIKGVWCTPDGIPSLGGPQKGDCLRVARVSPVTIPLVGKEVLMLGFTRFGSAGYAAAAFRKIHPRADEATAADAAFCADLRRRTLPAELEAASCCDVPPHAGIRSPFTPRFSRACCR